MCCLAVKLKRKITVEFTTMNNLTKHPKLLQFSFLLIVFFSFCFTINPSENNIIWRLPPLIKGFPLWIDSIMEYLMFEWLPIQVYDPEIEEFEQKPLLKEITRSLSYSINFLILFLRDILLGGVDTIASITTVSYTHLTLPTKRIV